MIKAAASARVIVTALMGLALIAGCNNPPDAGHRVYGYVDQGGNLVIPLRYLDARPFQEGLAAVRTAEGWGFIDRNGEWIIPPRFGDAGSFAGGRAAVQEQGGYVGYIDTTGQWVVAPQYTTASRFVGGRAIVEDQMLVDRDGKVTSELDFAAFDDWSDSLDKGESSDFQFLMNKQLREQEFRAIALSGLVPFRTVPYQVGYQDLDGNWVIEPQFSDAEPFFEGRARVSRDGSVGFIDRTGRPVTPIVFREALLRFSNDRTVAVSDGRALLIDSSGNRVADLGPWPWPEFEDHADFSDLSLYVGFSDFFADGLMPWQIGGKWGYVGLDGQWVIPPRYDSAQMFLDGRAGVQEGSDGIILDTAGQELARAQGRWIAPPGETPLRGGTETRWGFATDARSSPIDLPFSVNRVAFAGRLFPDARPLPFSEGLAIVSRFVEHRWSVVDIHGQTLGTALFDWVEPAGDGNFLFGRDQRWGLADAKLRPLTEAWMDYPLEFEAGAGIWVVQGDRRGCLEPSGRWMPLPPSIGYAVCRGSFMVASLGDDADDLGVIDRKGRWRIQPQEGFLAALVGAGPGYFILLDANNESSRISRIARVARAKVHYSESAQFAGCDPDAAEALCLMKVSDGWQWLDLRSLRPQGPVYEAVGVVVRGRAAVQRNARWGVIGVSGERVTDFVYDEIRLLQTDPNLVADLLEVRLGEHWGLLDLEGRSWLPPRYDEIRTSGQGLIVRSGEHWGAIGSGGNELTPVRYAAIELVTEDLVIAREHGERVLVRPDRDARPVPAPEWLPRAVSLASCLQTEWVFETSQAEVFLMNRDTLEVRELKPPAGQRWIIEEAEAFRAGECHPTTQAAALPLKHPLNPVLLTRTDRGEPTCRVVEAIEGPTWGDAWSIVTENGRCGVLNEAGSWIVAPVHDHCFRDEPNGGFLIGDDI
jgi:hypothetical protein